MKYNDTSVNIDMGECKFLDDTSHEILYTNGLGPCVGVAIVIKDNNEKVYRLLAHVVMGEGSDLEEMEDSLVGLKYCIRDMKKSINSKGASISNIETSLTSTESYLYGKEHNTSPEKALIRIILKELEKYGLEYNKIKYNHNSCVQISPDGLITTFNELEEGKRRL